MLRFEIAESVKLGEKHRAFIGGPHRMSTESSQTIALTRILLFDRPWQPSLLAELGLVARYRYRHGPGCRD